MRQHVLLLLILLSTSPSAALPPLDASFSRLTTREGLSHDSITALLQDRDGFLWVGTSAGLNRHDGQKVTRYRAGGAGGGLAHDHVLCLLQGRDGALWIGTHDGLSRLDPDTGRITSLRADGSKDALSNRHVAALAETPDGVLWIGGALGLDRLDPARGQVIRGPPGLRIDQMLLRPDGTLWLASTERLSRLDPRTLTVADIAGIPAGLQLRALFQDERGAPWVAASGQRLTVGRLDEQDGSWRWFRQSLAAPGPRIEALSLAGDGAGGLFLGTGDGLWHLDPSSGVLSRRYQHHPRLEDGLPGESVPVLLRDRQDGLWIGTFMGLARLDLRRPRLARYRPGIPPELGPHGGQIWALAEDLDGDIWVGSSQGLSRLNRSSELFTAESLVGSVSALLQDPKGPLYIGTPDGLLIREGGRQTWLRHDPSDPESLPESRPRVLQQDGEAGLYVGTGKAGVAWLDLRTRRFRRYPCAEQAPDRLPCRVMALAPAGPGRLWVGGLGGLFLFDVRAGQVLRLHRHDLADPRSLSRDTIISLARGRDGSLWVGTSGGLNRLPPSPDPATRPAAFTRFVTPQLPNDIINGIVEDGAGLLWLTTNDGLLRLDPRDGALRRFDAIDGLASNEFNQGAVATTRAGEVLVGGPRGFNLFAPAALTPDARPPAVRITAARLNGEPLPRQGALALGSHMRRLELDFAVLTFDRPGRSRASYRLEGLETEWTDAPGSGTVIYGPLPPGQYRFQVRGANADGIWNLTGASLALSTTPLWWRTGWAYAAYALCALWLLHRGHRFRVQALRRRAALLEARVAERTAALSRSQQEAVAAEQAKGQFLALMSHEIRTPLNAIIGLTGLLSRTPLTSEQSELLKTVHSSGDLLLSLINDILDFSKIESGKLELHNVAVCLRDCLTGSLNLLRSMAERKGLRLVLDIDEDVPGRVCLDPTRLRQVLLNLVGNGIKFTDRGEVAVHVQSRPAGEGHELLVTVRDTGPGIPPERQGGLFRAFTQGDPELSRRAGGTGLGLVICRRLCELMGGRIWLDRSVGRGATFLFTVHANKIAVEVDPAQAPTPATELGLRVLLCEDHEVNQWVTRQMLTHLGCQTRVVENGRLGLLAVQEAHYDVVLMDVMMPEMDGLMATRGIRQLSPEQLGGRPWIIAMSAGALPDEQRRCREAGMDDFLAKPARLEDLAQALQRAGVGGRQATGEGGAAAHAGPGAAVAVAGARDLGIEESLSKLEADLPGIRQELVADFDASIAERMQQISAAIEAEDWDTLRFQCHRAKGAVGFIGAQHLGCLYAEMELAARQRDPSRVHANQGSLQQESERVLRVLRGLA